MSNNGKITTLQLDGKIDFGSVKSLYDKLAASFTDGSKKVILDAEDCEEIDFSSMQLLVVYLKTAKSMGLDVDWENLPIMFYQYASELDLTEPLGL